LGSEWKSGQQFRPPPDWGSGFEFRGGPRAGGTRSGGARAGAQEQVFGGGGPCASAGSQREGRDHHARVDIDLEEAYGGATRTLELKRPDIKSDGTLEVKTHT